MGDASSIITFIILEDTLLLAILNVLPVSLEQYVDEGIASEHNLCRRCARGGANQEMYCMTYGT